MNSLNKSRWAFVILLLAVVSGFNVFQLISVFNLVNSKAEAKKLEVLPDYTNSGTDFCYRGFVYANFRTSGSEVPVFNKYGTPMRCSEFNNSTKAFKK